MDDKFNDRHNIPAEPIQVNIKGAFQQNVEAFGIERIKSLQIRPKKWPSHEMKGWTGRIPQTSPAYRKSVQTSQQDGNRRFSVPPLSDQKSEIPENEAARSDVGTHSWPDTRQPPRRTT